MNLSAPFIARPVATLLLSLALLLVGALSYRLLPVAPLPEMDFPVITVQANLPGASPQIMASTVPHRLSAHSEPLPELSK